MGGGRAWCAAAGPGAAAALGPAGPVTGQTDFW